MVARTIETQDELIAKLLELERIRTELFMREENKKLEQKINTLSFQTEQILELLDDEDLRKQAIALGKTENLLAAMPNSTYYFYCMN